jgi:hypothetical protein
LDAVAAPSPLDAAAAAAAAPAGEPGSTTAGRRNDAIGTVPDVRPFPAAAAVPGIGEEIEKPSGNPWAPPVSAPATWPPAAAAHADDCGVIGVLVIVSGPPTESREWCSISAGETEPCCNQVSTVRLPRAKRSALGVEGPWCCCACCFLGVAAVSSSCERFTRSSQCSRSSRRACRPHLLSPPRFAASRRSVRAPSSWPSLRRR